MTKEDMKTLKDIVDRSNMRTVLSALSEIAAWKGSYYSRDEKLAKPWRKAELQLDRLACNMPV